MVQGKAARDMECGQDVFVSTKADVFECYCSDDDNCGNYEYDICNF